MIARRRPIALVRQAVGDQTQHLQLAHGKRGRSDDGVIHDDSNDRPDARLAELGVPNLEASPDPRGATPGARIGAIPG